MAATFHSFQVGTCTAFHLDLKACYDFKKGCVSQHNILQLLNHAAGLEVWINSFIKDIGLRPFVLPEGITVPLTPGRVDGLVVRLTLPHAH